MHPTLFKLGELPIPTYGVAIAAGFLVAVLMGARAGRRAIPSQIEKDSHLQGLLGPGAMLWPSWSTLPSAC